MDSWLTLLQRRYDYLVGGHWQCDTQAFHKVRYKMIIYHPDALSSTLSHRWRSLSSPLFLALWLSLSCIGWMANVNDEIFLRGPKSTLWSETFFQCPAHSNGRRLRSGDKNTVRSGSRLWFSAQYSSSALRRFRYYSCQRFRDIDGYLKLLQSRHRPSRPTIQHLLQQVSRFKCPFPRRIYGNSSLLQLDHTIPCFTICKFFVSYFEGNVDHMITDLAGVLPSVRFPMGMSGGQVVGCSQNTSILPNPVSIKRTK